ncbi:MAG: sodium:calcium antiporter [Candidatus Diapherotrites archaeon]|nr:sodium:calcium antiporter [Candidatus Diapherotrites archaeon]
MGLILGLAGIIRPISVPKHVVTRDGIFMLVATIVVALIALEDLKLTPRDGIIFLLLFVPYAVNVYAQEKQLALRERKKEVESISKTLVMFGKLGNQFVIKSGAMIFGVGCLFLIAGSEFFTNGILEIASNLNISDSFIGITLGALGPSLPNLVVALQASKKGFDELVVSQSIGSNIFTLFVTLGFLSLLGPISLTNVFQTITAPALIIVTMFAFLFLLTGKIGKFEGIVLVLLYFGALVAESTPTLFGWT